MINSVSSSAVVTHQYLPSHPPAKAKETQKPDIVVLSHKVQGGDPDRDGD